MADRDPRLPPCDEPRSGFHFPEHGVMAYGGRRILNVGCGPDLYGTDFVDVYPARPEVVTCDVASAPLPFPSDTFDEVYSKNFLEHVPSLLHVVNEMARVAKPGGEVRCVTDNAGWILGHVPIRKANHDEHYSNEPRAGPMDRHYALFTPLHLRNLFERAGLEVTHVGYAYYSKRASVARVRGLVQVLSGTPLRHILLPHVEITGVKPTPARVH